MVSPEHEQWLLRQSWQPGPAKPTTAPQNRWEATVLDKEMLAQRGSMLEPKGPKEGPPQEQQGPGNHQQTEPSLTKSE